MAWKSGWENGKQKGKNKIKSFGIRVARTWNLAYRWRVLKNKKKLKRVAA